MNQDNDSFDDDSEHQSEESRIDDIAFRQSPPSRRWYPGKRLRVPIQETNLCVNRMLVTPHQRLLLERKARIRKPLPPSLKCSFAVNACVMRCEVAATVAEGQPLWNSARTDASLSVDDNVWSLNTVRHRSIITDALILLTGWPHRADRILCSAVLAERRKRTPGRSKLCTSLRETEEVVQLVE